MERLSPILEVNQTIMFGNFTNTELDSIISTIKFARAQIAKQNKNAMTIGTPVKFVSSRDGRTVLGTVKKLNRKYILVTENKPGIQMGATWRVPANMLEVA
jgi:hypothetical protein